IALGPSFELMRVWYRPPSSTSTQASAKKGPMNLFGVGGSPGGQLRVINEWYLGHSLVFSLDAGAAICLNKADSSSVAIEPRAVVALIWYPLEWMAINVKYDLARGRFVVSTDLII